MIQVGLPFEHVNAKREAVERLAKTRGLIAGALAAGVADPTRRERVERERVLFDDAMRRYAAPRVEPVGATRERPQPVTMETLRDSWKAFDDQPEVFLTITNREDWWRRATTVVDAYQSSLAIDSAELEQRAIVKMDALDNRKAWTVATLITLGLLTVGLVLATFRRVVEGLDRLLGGLDHVARHRQLTARIDYRASDEFGHISDGVNRLVAMVQELVAERDERARVDALTGVLNRNGLDEQIEARLNPHRGDVDEQGLLLIDVDHFKRVNDTHGHVAGDRVLTRLGALLRAELRSDDVVGRYGGEEFLVLLTHCREDSFWSSPRNSGKRSHQRSLASAIR
jgi:GGDEF domain-containing protein